MTSPTDKQSGTYTLTSERATHKPKQYFNLVAALSLSEFKLRYFGSVLGYFWTLARPLMLFGVLYVVFTNIVRFGTGTKFYPVLILSGIVLWTYFSEATAGSVVSIFTRENLVRKMAFPISAIPLSTTITATLTLILNLIAVIIFMAISGVTLHWTTLEYPFLIIAIFVITLPFSFILSVLYVRFRDVQHIWDVVIQMGFWASPIIYPIEKVPDNFQRILMFNPVAAVIQQVRHAVIDPTAPSVIDVMGGVVWLAVPVGIVIALYVISFFVFRSEAPKVAELL